MENVLMAITGAGVFLRGSGFPFSEILAGGTGHGRRGPGPLTFIGLGDKEDQDAQSLAYGQQRKLEIARALATKPQLLLLDEPAAGMNPRETEELMGLIRKVRRDLDLSILVIEHDMKFVAGLCQEVKVLDYGSTIAEGTPELIQHHPRVIEAYLGQKRNRAGVRTSRLITGD